MKSKSRKNNKSDSALPSQYNHREVEERWRDHWEKGGYFRGDVKGKGEPFVIVIPPPNITSKLHIGHVPMLTLQDLLIRWQRMRGRNVCWVPGTDHAGIATQNVVERELAKAGKTRHDLGREEFVKKVWAWREEYGNAITEQVRRLGCSCDWPRQKFTLDEDLSRAVREQFVRLYEEGLIYRGSYIVNWCPRCGTAISDLEVEYEEEDAHLYHITYPFVEGEGGLVVATTRPETLFGDTAVAVNPKDKRHRGVVGKKVRLPLTEREIPVIGDDYVDTEFGTGALKITPAHDPNDFEVGQRHKLPVVVAMDEGAVMNEAAGKYKGMSREDCRAAAVKDLEKEGLLVKTEDYHHSVGHCSRCHVAVEPYYSRQWFVRMKEMAAAAIKASDKGEVVFHPARWSKLYKNWLENIRDWCISRQLWWGHRIPVFYCAKCDKEIVTREDVSKCPDCGGGVKQDEDVLDTWFSSNLWPFSVFGWPEETAELKKFYPTSVLVTSWDIIFFWVARMVMAGLKFMGEVPFKDVIINSLIMDEHGKKMSKSSDAAVDPLEVMDKYGTDAMRFSYLISETFIQHLPFSIKRVEGHRNFINKIWNASRYILSKLEGENVDLDKLSENLEPFDYWILDEHRVMTEEMDKAMQKYRFYHGAEAAYHYFWHSFCDHYLEYSKLKLVAGGKRADSARRVLLYVLERFVRLMHPMMPFVSEELYSKLPDAKESVVLAGWPEAKELDFVKKYEAEIKLARAARELGFGINTWRSFNKISPKIPNDYMLFIPEGGEGQALGQESFKEYFRSLIRNGNITVSKQNKKVAKDDKSLGCHGTCTMGTVPKAMMDRRKEDAAKRCGELEKLIEAKQKRLADPKFTKQAPERVIEAEKKKLGEYQAELARLTGE